MASRIWISRPVVRIKTRISWFAAPRPNQMLLR